MSKDRSALLGSLGLEAQNAGACAAPDDWRGGGPNLASVSPSDESPIANVAVGQSRMLYGKTMHSERPAHRMYEQWHPLGVVGVITAFNFPVAVWAWNALLSAICGNATVWKPSPKTPLAAIAVQNLCNRIMAELDLPAIFTLLIDAGREAAARLASDPRVALVSFTGSSAVGHQIAGTVAGRFGRTLL